jgi:hypothetical protein
MLAMQSVAAAYAGQVRRARKLTETAIDLAMSRGLKEGAGLYSAGSSLWEAAYGNCREAQRTTARALSLSRGRSALRWSALALAMCGESGAAQRLTAEMSRRFPQDSFMSASWLPMTHAALEIRRGPARAIQMLERAGASSWYRRLVVAVTSAAHLAQGAGNRPGPSSRRSWTAGVCWRRRT